METSLGGSVVKDPLDNTGDLDLISGSRERVSLGDGNDKHSMQVLHRKSHGQERAWRAIFHGVTESESSLGLATEHTHGHW